VSEIDENLRQGVTVGVNDTGNNSSLVTRSLAIIYRQCRLHLGEHLIAGVIDTGDKH
jgi:hypothetical protein